MLINRHPADELADVRAQLQRLKAREAQLRALFLADDGDDFLTGTTHRVVLRRAVARVFCRARLPDAILSDPAMYAVRQTLQVVVRPTCETAAWQASPPIRT